MSTLSGKVAIVTGASSGIGEAVALELAKGGVRVVLAARRDDRLAALENKIVAAGGAALALSCDVSERDQVEKLVAKTLESFDQVDILINNAGIMPLALMSKCRFDEWDDMLDVNVRGVLNCIGWVLPHMLARKTGHIVNVSSVAGRKVFPTAAVYCATKHAVHAISEGLRYELAESAPKDGNQIRITTIAPGVVSTELPDSIRDDQTREGFKSYAENLPGPLTSEDIAESILFALKSPAHVGINEILIRPRSQIR